jgi:hypothetical protein
LEIGGWDLGSWLACGDGGLCDFVDFRVWILKEFMGEAGRLYVME